MEEMYSFAHKVEYIQLLKKLTAFKATTLEGLIYLIYAIIKPCTLFGDQKKLSGTRP